jgi:hypothetical protein
MKTITKVQLLTLDFICINLEPSDIQYIELHDPDGDYSEVSYAKIIIKNAEICLKPSYYPSLKRRETVAEAYGRLLSKNVYGITIVQGEKWNKYHFSPYAEYSDVPYEELSYEELEELSGWEKYNNRVKIEKVGECTIITA